MEPPALHVADGPLAPEGSGCRLAYRYDAGRPDLLDLFEQMRQAGGDLFVSRSTCLLADVGPVLADVTEEAARVELRAV